MMMQRACFGLAAAVALAAVPAASIAQPAPAAAEMAQDCSRWPASQFDAASASCRCPQGMWWNIRGDACLPREHAAAELCSTVWPSSQPLFVDGGYRCVCAPTMTWDAEAAACRPSESPGVQECESEWPGTVPIVAPSGTDFECRCPAGRRWDEAGKTCVDGAPVVSINHDGFGTAPAPSVWPPAATPPAGAPGAEAPAAPGQIPPAVGAPVVPSPAAPVVPPVRKSSNSQSCDAMLAEIRARAAAGRGADADALGMQAAVAGCDPKEISDAAKVRKPTPVK